MDLFMVAIVLVLVLVAVGIAVSDCDLTLAYADKYGQKLANLHGKVIWITGASSGIGAATAEKAAQLGARIVLSARSRDKLEEVHKRCLEVARYHGRKEEDFLVLPMDVTKLETHADCLQAVLDRFGKLDIMFHNAGQSQRANWEKIDIQVDKDMFDLNVFSIVNLTRLIIPHFLSNGGGAIAVMSSAAGKAGAPFSGTYTATKHALHGYFESLRSEKLGSGINITMICPGPVVSNLLRVAATENAGEKFNEDWAPSANRMPTERCAHLSLVAVAHGLSEVWISPRPILQMLYASQYLPAISKTMMRLIGTKGFQKMRDSRVTVKS